MISLPRGKLSALALGGLAALAVLAGAGSMDRALALETKAREALLFDFETGTVLLEKDADVPMPPASMSKIMTAFMVFEQLKDGHLSLDDRLPVSEKAWRMGGSKMFVKVGESIRVEDLLRGIIVQSGNDACIVIAEGLSGSEDAFAEAMTTRAAELGMSGSTFANSTGWPHPDHRMTARDLVSLATRIIRDYPTEYGYFGERDFTWSDITQGNRNPLLYRDIGADGLKTGHTEEAGYGLTASAVQGGRRLVLVLNGLSSKKERSEESARLMSWGLRQFKNYKLFEAGAEVERVPVWLGDQDRVPLVAPQQLVVTLERAARKGMKVTLVYDGPIPAPIKKGQTIAHVRITAPDSPTVELPLQAGADIGRLGPFGRIFAAIKYLIFGSS